MGNDLIVTLALAATSMVFAAGVIVLLAWVAGNPNPSQGECVLKYGRIYRGVAWMVMLAAIGTAIAVPVGRWAGITDDRKQLILGLRALVYLSVGIPYLMEVYRRQVVLSDSGFSVTGLLGRTSIIEWGEIDTIRNRQLLGVFQVHAGSKWVWVSQYMTGIEKFVDECRKRLPGAVYGNGFNSILNRQRWGREE